jgi:hypothetical protein
LADSRFFNELRRKKLKKFSPAQLASQVAPDRSAHTFLTFALSPLAAGRPSAGPILPIEIYSTLFCSTQGIASARIARAETRIEARAPALVICRPTVWQVLVEV